MKLTFRSGRPEKTLTQWVVYSASTVLVVSLVVHYGNVLLRSRHGEFVRDAVCAVSRALPPSDVSRLLSSLCRSAADGNITPKEARQGIDRAAAAAGVARSFFDNDGENTNLRVEDEVSFAVEQWKKLNPSPIVDPTLRRQFPAMSEAQLCVLSQAERYVEGNAIGIRYVGMGVCEETP